MSKHKKIIFISSFLILSLLAFGVLYTMKQMYTPTQGAQIAKYENPHKALLVIDVQEDYTGTQSQKEPLLKQIDAPFAVINKLIEESSKNEMLVIYIRQVFDDNFITRTLVGRTIEGHPGTEIDSRIKTINENDFTKKISDAFSNPKLDDFLIQNQVNELYLVGLDAAYCVYYTALGGLNRSYKVHVITDAIISRKDIKVVLETYKKDRIDYITSSQILMPN